jgi:hypothetical protein
MYVHHDLLVRKLAPSSKVLERLLIRLLSAAVFSSSHTAYIHLLIDGLNECPDSTQVQIFKFLQKLVACSGQTVLKVLLITRTDSAISNALRGNHQVSLAEERNQLREDINLYVSSFLERLRPKLRQLRLDQDDIQSLSAKIVDRADGMYKPHTINGANQLAGMIHWAKLVLQYIDFNLLLSKDEVFDAAGSFPRELSQLYIYTVQITISILLTFNHAGMLGFSRLSYRGLTKDQCTGYGLHWAGLLLPAAHFDKQNFCQL